MSTIVDPTVSAISDPNVEVLIHAEIVRMEFALQAVVG